MRITLISSLVLFGLVLVGCSGGDPPVQTADAKGTENIQSGTKNEGAGQVRAEKGMRQTTNPPGRGREYSGGSVGDAAAAAPNAPQ